MELEKLHELVIEALEDLKGNDLVSLDMRGKLDITDMMVVASGTSDRHVQALADSVVEKAKKAGVSVAGVEKDRAWVLIDLYEIIVHVMLPETRDFYNLEKLWQLEIPSEQAQNI